MCFYVEGGGGGDERDKEREAEGFAYNGDYLKVLLSNISRTYKTF